MNPIKSTVGAALAAGLAVPYGAAHAAEYASVVSATPAVAQVAVPRQECADGEQYVQPAPSGAGALIGAIAGGVVGNQFGHGFGRAAATGLGVVAGSAIGNNVEANATPPAAVPVRRCRTVSAYENRVIGYDVVYEYNGRRYTTRTASDPGPRLAIDVRPSAPPPLDRVGPLTTYQAVPPAYAQAPSQEIEPAAYAGPPGAYAGPPGAYAGPPSAYDGPPSAYDGPPSAYDGPPPAYVAPRVYVAPAPAYYAPAPAYYYGPPAVVVRPQVGFGVWGGGRRHWRGGYWY